MPVLALILTLAAPAQLSPSDAPSDTLEQAVARTIAEALPDLRRPWGLDESAFGVRGGEMAWHMSGPNDPPLPGGVYRRTGWITVRGASADVAVCGDGARIGGLAVSAAGLWLDRGERGLIAELAVLGVRADLIETQPADLARFADLEGVGGDRYRALVGARPALQRWHLEKPGHAPADLSAAHACTPPGTRHATHCRITWTLAFRPDDPIPQDPLPGADCPLPGRAPGETAS